MNTIRIRTISRETKIIYTLWVVFSVCMCAYTTLLAASMVYGVEKKTADRRVYILTKELADNEAKLVNAYGTLTEEDAYAAGLVRISERISLQSTNKYFARADLIR